MILGAATQAWVLHLGNRSIRLSIGDHLLREFARRCEGTSRPESRQVPQKAQGVKLALARRALAFLLHNSLTYRPPPYRPVASPKPCRFGVGLWDRPAEPCNLRNPSGRPEEHGSRPSPGLRERPKPSAVLHVLAHEVHGETPASVGFIPSPGARAKPWHPRGKDPERRHSCRSVSLARPVFALTCLWWPGCAAKPTSGHALEAY